MSLPLHQCLDWKRSLHPIIATTENNFAVIYIIEKKKKSSSASFFSPRHDKLILLSFHDWRSVGFGVFNQNSKDCSMASDDTPILWTAHLKQTETASLKLKQHKQLCRLQQNKAKKEICCGFGFFFLLAPYSLSKPFSS